MQPDPKQQPVPAATEPMDPCGVPVRIVASDRWRRVWEQLLAPLPEEDPDAEGAGDDERKDVSSL